MSQIFFKKRERRASVFATLGLVTLCFAAIAFLAAGPFFRIEAFRALWGNGDDLNIRLRLVTVSLRLVALGGVFTLAGIIHGLTSPRVRISWRGFAAVLMLGAIGWPTWTTYSHASSAPALHDITTNLEDPPQFAQLPAAADGTPVQGGRESAEYRALHQSQYSDLASMKLAAPPADAAAKALQVASSEGWKIVASDLANGRIEAVTESRWFGFRTRLVVRVRANAAGSLLDIRAVSEMGVGDWGIGAALIRSYMNALAA
ncbi:MAG: DUF1499 domain-containing protein [Alphaproteobacteria bacterium]|nr:MAG: DUF1499 domain-containing protein [Alphaproteobacteria bacterium]